MFPEAVHNGEFSLGNDENSLVVIDPSKRNIGIIFSLIGAIGAGLVPIAVRFCGPTVHYLSLTWSFAVTGLIVATTALCVRPEPIALPSASDPASTIFLMLNALFATAAQCLYNAGSQLEKPTTSNLIRTLDVLANALCQAFVVGNPLTAFSFLGMSLIVGSTLLVVVVKVYDGRKLHQKALADEYRRMQSDQGLPNPGLGDVAAFEIEMED